MMSCQNHLLERVSWKCWKSISSTSRRYPAWRHHHLLPLLRCTKALRRIPSKMIAHRDNRQRDLLETGNRRASTVGCRLCKPISHPSICRFRILDTKWNTTVCNTVRLPHHYPLADRRIGGMYQKWLADLAISVIISDNACTSNHHKAQCRPA